MGWWKIYKKSIKTKKRRKTKKNEENERKQKIYTESTPTNPFAYR
jgi:hypothetical protein